MRLGGDGQRAGRGPRRAWGAAALAGVGLAFGLNASAGGDKIAKHSIFADDGAQLALVEPLRFALVGNTRGPVPAADGARLTKARPGSAKAIIADIAALVGTPEGPQALFHLGDGVESGSAGAFKLLDKRWIEVLASSTPHPAGKARLKAVYVAGDREAAGDERYEALGAAFPELGADIGFQRVASWTAFDLQSEGKTWRFLVLDPAKERLGSRWTEQLGWIKRTLDPKTGGKFDGMVILMHDPVLDLGGKAPAMNLGGGPEELVDLVEGSIGVSRLRAVISAGHHTHQVLLPDGPLGVLHLGVGGGGAPADDLMRWAPADSAGRAADVPLEPMFDLTLMDQLDRVNRAEGLPPQVVDQAKARDSFEGFTGAYNAGAFPVQGWWTGTLRGDTLRLAFRYLKPDGSFEEVYQIEHRGADGWAPKKLTTKAPRSTAELVE